MMCLPDILKEMKLEKCSTPMTKFIEGCLTCVWLMKVQCPPVALLWQKPGTPCDKNRFTFYTQRGTNVVQTVWPAVLLHENGPLMSKGVVQGK